MAHQESVQRRLEGENSVAGFLNLERRLLTAGIGVCSTSGGD